MALRTHTIEKKGEKRNQIWEWEETPEVTEALKRLHQDIKTMEDKIDAKSLLFCSFL